jgi:hypothetical protein
MFRQSSSVRNVALAVAAAAILEPGLGFGAPAQHRDWDWDGNYQRLVRINPGTYVTVRTTRPIDLDRTDGRMFPALVEEDVWDDYHRLIVPAIPRGSRVDLLVRSARDGDLILDLDCIYANGQRYIVSARPERVENEGMWRRGNEDAAAMVAGGALLGTIIGSIAGGGKGAVIGGGAGAAAMLGLALQGRSIHVPAGSVLTFRLNEGLEIAPGPPPRYPRYPR